MNRMKHAFYLDADDDTDAIDWLEATFGEPKTGDHPWTIYPFAGEGFIVQLGTEERAALFESIWGDAPADNHDDGTFDERRAWKDLFGE